MVRMGEQLGLTLRYERGANRRWRAGCLEVSNVIGEGPTREEAREKAIDALRGRFPAYTTEPVDSSRTIRLR